jgi:hypothetical protein
VRDAYDAMIIDRFKNIFVESDVQVPVYTRTCDEVRNMLFARPDSALALEYIITCFGEGDLKLKREIVLRQKEIVPPLIAALKGLNGDATEQDILSYIRSKIAELKDQIDFRQMTLLEAQQREIDAGAILSDPAKTDATKLTENDMGMMLEIDESYFGGVSHATDVEIEKYDNGGVLVGTYTTHTDIFGWSRGIDIGEFVAGQDYTLKIRLKNEKFVLPKIVKLQINNATKTTEGSYETTLVIFERHFRFGDFNEDDKIDLLDIAAWGDLLRGEYAGGYELWQLWEFANLDGIEGIDLLDVLTLEQNWGGVEEYDLLNQ